MAFEFGKAAFYLSVVICIIFMIIIIVPYKVLLDKDSEQTKNLFGVVFGTAMATSIAVFATTAWLFKGNPNMLMYFILFILLIVLMPMSVCSAALSTAQLNGLRDAIAVSTSGSA